LVGWLSASLALWIVDSLFESLWFDGFGSLLLASAVLTVFNLTLKPVLMLLSLPLIVLSLGLAIPLMNGLFLLLVADLIDGFHVSGYWMAVLAALAFSVIRSLISLAVGERRAGLTVQVQQRPRRPKSPPGDGDVIDVEAREKKD
jgi:putative membrane protein